MAHMPMAIDRDQVLADAGALLLSSLDYEDTLANISALGLAAQFDYCILDVEDEPQRRRFCVANADPANAELAHALELLISDHQRAGLVRAVLQSGESRLFHELPAGFLEACAHDETHLALLRRLRIRTLIGTPLRTPSRVIGAMLLVSCSADRPYTVEDQALAEALGGLFALALCNALEHRECQRAIRARNEVLLEVAHDLRGPLAAIMLSSAATGPVPGTPERRRPVSSIGKMTQHMDRLIEGLLDVARIDTGELELDREHVPAGALVADAAEVFRPMVDAASLNLQVKIPREMPTVLADRGRVRQVFSNLIGNAVKFTDPGGTLELSAHSQPGAAQFTVSDTGAGMDEEALQHAFDRFWRKDKKDSRGTGLGLTICKGIVERHGGTIYAESTPGRGTTISFTLPATVSPLDCVDRMSPDLEAR